MPEGLQSNINIDEQVFNTSSVKDNLFQKYITYIKIMYKIQFFTYLFILDLSTSDKENQSNSNVLNLSIKILEKTDENHTENTTQKIVFKQIQNQMSDQGLYKNLRLFIILIL